VRASARILPFVLLVGAAPHLTRPSRLALCPRFLCYCERSRT
jgi:hypothetical protein